MRITKIITLIICSFLLNGCLHEQCIDADDFGFARFTISSVYDKNASPQQLFGEDDHQIGIWIDSGYIVNGEPLTIVVKNWNSRRDRNNAQSLSAWCPWYGSDKNSNSLSDLQVKFPECIWENGQFCTETSTAQISNAPCLLKKGVGLYALIAQSGFDPNSNLNVMASPPQDKAITFHIGDKHPDYMLFDNVTTLRPSYAQSNSTIDSNNDTQKPTNNAMITLSENVSSPTSVKYSAKVSQEDSDTSDAMYPEEAGGIVYKYDGVDKAAFANGKLYFKILDSHYNDNGGQYIVVIKSGIRSAYQSPVTKISNIISNTLFGNSTSGYNTSAPDINSNNGVISRIFNAIISNAEYRSALSSILTIFVILSAFSYLIGITNFTHTELIISMLKISIVSILLHPSYGWSFFNNNLLTLIFQVPSYIASEIGSISPGNGPSDLLGILTTPQLLAKLSSMLFTSYYAPLYIMFYIILLILIAQVVLRGLMIYFSSIILLMITTALAPIFLSFILFERTKSLFENWFKSMILHSVTVMIITIVTAIIGIQVQHTIYANFGFRICRQYFPDFQNSFQALDEITGINITSPFFWWIPSPMIGKDFSKTLVTIPVPESHIDSSGKFCPAYGCNEQRYYDLPFLDPKNDAVRIQNFFRGDFMQFMGFIYLIILTYLLSRSFSYAVIMAQSISNIQIASLNVTHIVQNMTIGQIKKYLPQKSSITKMFKRGATSGNVSRNAQHRGSSMDKSDPNDNDTV